SPALCASTAPELHSASTRAWGGESLGKCVDTVAIHDDTPSQRDMLFLRSLPGLFVLPGDYQIDISRHFLPPSFLKNLPLKGPTGSPASTRSGRAWAPTVAASASRGGCAGRD